MTSSTMVEVALNELRMLIWYKMMGKEMMDMVTMVVHRVVEILEVVVVVVWLVEVEARLCAITIIRQGI